LTTALKLGLGAREMVLFGVLRLRLLVRLRICPCEEVEGFVVYVGPVIGKVGEDSGPVVVS
jgi:hypothetical protein